MEDMIFYLKVIGLLVAFGVIAFLVWLSASFVLANQWAGLVVLGLVGVLLAGLFWIALKWIQEKIEARNARISLHKLEVQERKAALEAAAESRKLAADTWRFEAWYKAEQLRLQAEQQSLLHFGANEVLARSLPGGGVDIAYVPMPRLAERVVTAEVGDKVWVTESELDALPAPHARRIPTASELLAAGELDGDDILMGFDVEGRAVRYSWKRLMALLILGVMGGGKTNTVSWLIGQEIWRGARIALIDKHARFDESTYRRVKIFANQFELPVGGTPQAAMRVIKHVKGVYEQRLEAGGVPEYTLLFAIDEFTAIMSALEDKEDEWYEVARALKWLLGKLNSEGRKLGIHVVCVGQASNASRSGGTDIRDLFPTRIVHAMRARQASMLGLTEEKKSVQKLETGQVYVDIMGKDDPFKMSVPEVDDAYLAAVARAINARNGAFMGRSQGVQTEALGVHERESERPVNDDMNGVQALYEREERVLELRKIPMGKAAIIEEIWGAKKGGTAAYKNAEAEYEKIVEKLVALGYVKIEQ